MLTTEDLLDQVLIASGQYVGGLESTLLRADREFNQILKRELSTYNRFRMNRRTAGFELYDNKVFQLQNDLFIPEFIIKITRDTPNTIFSPQSVYGNLSNYYWRYEKPVLRFSYTRRVYEVTALVKHEATMDDNGVITEFPTLSLEDERFIDLVTARFMMALGQSRSNFQIPELSLQIDAQGIAQRGISDYQNAIETLRSEVDITPFFGY